MLATVGATVAACSAASVTPDIEKFSDAVAAAIVAENKNFDEVTFGKKVAKARRLDLVAVGAAYHSSDAEACLHKQPALRVVQKDFAKVCRMIAKDAKGRKVATVYDTAKVQETAAYIAPATDKKTAQAFHANGIRNDLDAYAKALKAMAESNNAADLQTSAAEAIGAAGGLVDAVRASEKFTGEGGSAKKLSAVSEVVGLVAKELAEAAKYRKIRSVVKSADPFVRRASVQLALIAYESEKEGLETTAALLTTALEDFDAGTEAGLAAIEKAHKDIVEADEKARYRIYSDIGRTHAAILKSLTNGGSLEDFQEAQSRIVALLEAVNKL
ncbi:hypothetical protein NBRC116590_28570 [Pelagimonas sp. KU-00592-HH]|uniref:hypothetical protein n=1 Tax=Pelagimonas sp. KU-00592-HH TaxID=3127651 RepID=UPI00310B1B26